MDRNSPRGEVIEKQIGGTRIQIIPPALMSDEEREQRHKRIVKAVAECLRSSKSE